jgi:rhamnosyl/mannosyltransferase
MTRKLKILEVNKFYAPHIGGIETLVQQRAEYFAGRPDTDVRVLVCQETRKKAESRQVNGVSVYYCSSLGTFFSCPLSLDFFRKFKEMAEWADVAEFHTPFPLGDAVCLLSKCGCRVVIAWHSDVIKQKFLLQCYKPLLKRFLKRADAIITATKGHIEGSDFLPEFAEKCRIIPYPLDASLYAEKPHEPILRRKDASAVKVLFVGRLVYYKGVEYLIEAFRKVHGCELFICGTGKLENDLKAQAKGLPVHFLGRLSDADLKAAFADCDLFVLPSVERSEAFGIVQQEAMACGKPVINTALRSGVPYVSVHGQTGLTVPPKDPAALANAIQRLADDAELRARFGRRAAEKVRREYAPDSIMEQILDVLKEGI